MPAKPPPTAACACARLRRASRALTQLYDDAMASSGLRVTQYSLLRTLERRGTACLSDLAEALLLDRTALARTLDPLAARGLVALAPGRDARMREVSLTPGGEKALCAALPQWQQAQAQVAATLGTARLEGLIATLARLEAMHPDSGGRAPERARAAGARAPRVAGRRRREAA